MQINSAQLSSFVENSIFFHYKFISVFLFYKYSCSSDSPLNAL